MKVLKVLIIAVLSGVLLAACFGTRRDVSTRSYILTTGFEGGELVYLGVGGEINGIINPTLQGRPGETITIMLVNGGEGKHEFYIPYLEVKSERVTEKGESASVTFTLPDDEIDLKYYDSVGNNAEIGMLGIFRVSADAAPSGAGKDPDTSKAEAIAPSAPQNQDASAGAQIFQQKCASCHTIGGGPLVGPDLQGVTQRRDLEWLKSFIAEPDKLIASGDPIALELLAEFNNIAMPNLGLTDQEVEDLLVYLSPQEEQPSQESGDQNEAENPTPPQPSGSAGDVLSVDGDPVYGEYLFTGEVPLINRGTPCIACHSVAGVGQIGGGSLGPDLTHVYTRYGREGLAASLVGLPFPSMQSIFTNKSLTTAEQADLLAFFAEVDQQGEPRAQQNFQLILGIGSGLAVALFAVMFIFWPRQRKSLSQRLRENGKL